MAYNEQLADRVREALADQQQVEEKKMFSGLAFLLNGKMCINVSGDDLMVRFDPSLQDKISEMRGFRPMIMKGKQLDGYAYISKEGFHSKKDFDYWVKLCLDFNKKAKSSKKKQKQK